MKNSKVTVTISISSDLLALIDRAAAQEGRTRSNLINRLLTYALKDICTTPLKGARNHVH